MRRHRLPASRRMNPGQAVLIAGSGLLAGAINAVAGGGSFLTLPVLVACGIPPLPANATSAVALWPGTLASFGAYRRELATGTRLAGFLAVVSLLGGTVGAYILLRTPVLTFDQLLPWLTLFATGLFAFGARVSTRLKLSLGSGANRRSLLAVGTIQFILSIYGGYYGAGAGIMLLAVLALLGMKNIHAMNAFKTLLTSAFNGAAVGLFIVRGVVHWPAALCLMAGGLVGGYGGASLARRLPPQGIRCFVLLVGESTTAYFFWRAYLR